MSERNEQIKEFFRKLPKAELHLHLLGASTAQLTLQQVNFYTPIQAIKTAPERHLKWFRTHPAIAHLLQKTTPIEFSDLTPLFNSRTFPDFLTSILFTSYFYKNTADLEKLIQSVQAELIRDNVVYAEISVSLGEYLNQGMALDEVLTLLKLYQSNSSCRINWIVDLVRNFGAERCQLLLKEILNSSSSNSICGITLGGDEVNYPAKDFVAVYALAREAGLKTSVHAGEASGAESVADALNFLKPDRLGHGVRSIEDPELIKSLRTNGIPLEICISSNLSTGVYKQLTEHPIKHLYRAGLNLTLNSDDPLFFNTSLSNEYLLAWTTGLTVAEISELALNAYQQAFLPAPEILALRAKCSTFIKEFGSGL